MQEYSHSDTDTRVNTFTYTLTHKESGAYRETKTRTTTHSQTNTHSLTCIIYTISVCVWDLCGHWGRKPSPVASKTSKKHIVQAYLKLCVLSECLGLLFVDYHHTLTHTLSHIQRVGLTEIKTHTTTHSRTNTHSQTHMWVNLNIIWLLEKIRFKVWFEGRSEDAFRMEEAREFQMVGAW